MVDGRAVDYVSNGFKTCTEDLLASETHCIIAPTKKSSSRGVSRLCSL